MKKLLPLLGIAVGIAIGLYVPITISKEYLSYFAAIIFVFIDAALGGIGAAAEKTFDTKKFVIGLAINLIASAFFLYIGKLFGIDVYLVIIIVFGLRIFTNISKIRRLLLNSNKNSDKINFKS